MNKSDKKKKHIMIVILSVLAVCLVACLAWYVGAMRRTELPVVRPEVPETEMPVAVPEIDTNGIVGIQNETGLEREQEAGETEEETEGLLSEEEHGEETPTVPETPPVCADEKVQTPKDAVPPSEPPVDAGNVTAVENPNIEGECQPENEQPQENQPQGGDTNAAGAVYVPGFGYIENSGPNEQKISHTDGDWDKQIGTMQ